MAKQKVLRAWIITLSCVCAALVLSLIISLWLTNRNYIKQLENVYQRSYLELIGNIDDIEVDFSKLIATNSVASQNDILRSLYISCVLANANLNALPISGSKLGDINGFINTCGGFVFSLVEKTTLGTKLSASDFLNIENLHTKSKVMLFDLNSYAAHLSYNFKITEHVNISDEFKSDFNAGIIVSENPASNVPSLIYDGPFSDSVINKTVKGLPETIISYEQAEQKINKLYEYYKFNSFKYTGETLNKFETYNFSLFCDNAVYYVQITKRGGLLLNITSYGGGGSENLTPDECKNLAVEIAAQFGYESLHPVWLASSGNITFVNLAPIINKVIYYPDLIKIKVDNKSGTVVGFEATNYAYNNVSRGAFRHDISIIDAESLISTALTVKERNFCVIPNKFVGESFAYEFICKWKDYIYYVYLDASTGVELNIMREIRTNSYTLLL